MFRVLKLDITIDAKNSILTKVNDTRLIGRLRGTWTMYGWLGQRWLRDWERFSILRWLATGRKTEDHSTYRFQIISKGKSIIIGSHGPYGKGASCHRVHYRRLWTWNASARSERLFLNDMSPGEDSIRDDPWRSYMNLIFSMWIPMYCLMPSWNQYYRWRMTRQPVDSEINILYRSWHFWEYNRVHVHQPWTRILLLDRMVEIDIEKWFQTENEIIYNVNWEVQATEWIGSIIIPKTSWRRVRYGSEGEGLSEVQKLIDTVGGR
jgi:hypothetical protein